MTTLFLIRHGQTHWNLEGKYTGQSDIPLNSTGRLQALQAALVFRNAPPDAFYASDLTRAIETAEIVANGCGFLAQIETDSRLREINQGVWEGMHFEDIKAKWGAEFTARESNPLKVAAPGGETVGEVQKRVLAALVEICRAYKPDARIAIVAHGLTLAIVRAWHLNQPIQDVWSLIPPNAKVLEITVDPKRFQPT